MTSSSFPVVFFKRAGFPRQVEPMTEFLSRENIAETLDRGSFGAHSTPVSLKGRFGLPLQSAMSLCISFGTGGLNPYGEAVSSATGLIGGGIAYSQGGNFNRGFMAGNIVGGLLGAGLDDYGRALLKGADRAGARADR